MLNVCFDPLQTFVSRLWAPPTSIRVACRVSLQDLFAFNFNGSPIVGRGHAAQRSLADNVVRFFSRSPASSGQVPVAHTSAS
jgi:hypothetical protein